MEHSQCCWTTTSWITYYWPYRLKLLLQQQMGVIPIAYTKSGVSNAVKYSRAPVVATNVKDNIEHNGSSLKLAKPNPQISSRKYYSNLFITFPFIDLYWLGSFDGRSNTMIWSCSFFSSVLQLVWMVAVK